jgi:DNA polymerase-1
MVSFVKKAFGTPKGYVIVQGDLSQAELRIIAEYAKETNMIKAYKEDIDLHELTASKVRGMTVEQFRELDEKEYKRYRYEAKSVNFGYIYLMSAEGYKDYARTNYGIEISIKKARDTRAAFFKTYPRLLQYHNDYINKAKKFGYVRTLFGRKVHLPDIESLNRTKYSHAERNSVNAPIQGTAGEWTIFALALISIRAPWLELVNSVHDSIIPYVKKEDRDEAMRIMAEAMENPPIKEYFDRELSSVEMKVDFEASDTSWGDLKEV